MNLIERAADVTLVRQKLRQYHGLRKTRPRMLRNSRRIKRQAYSLLLTAWGSSWNGRGWFERIAAVVMLEKNHLCSDEYL